jgi:hypothetical protein
MAALDSRENAWYPALSDAEVTECSAALDIIRNAETHSVLADKRRARAKEIAAHLYLLSRDFQSLAKLYRVAGGGDTEARAERTVSKVEGMQDGSYERMMAEHKE